jgi:hypothetical protein
MGVERMPEAFRAMKDLQGSEAGSEDDIKRLKAEMADAHPDRGGTSETFAIARQRYLDARGGGRVQQGARAGFKNAKDLAKLPNGMHADRQCRGLYVQVRRDSATGARAMSFLYQWKPLLEAPSLVRRLMNSGWPT